MRLTKLGHACVRLSTDRVTVVIDPGCFTEPGALDGADAVLITHGHPDHVVPERLRAAAAAAPGLEVWTNPQVAAEFADLGGRVQAVADGDSFTAGGERGLPVRVHGARHAVIHRDIPVIDNVGFLVDGAVFHPGDALTVPEDEVPTLLVPACAPWLKTGEAIDFVRAVAPDRAYAIHDHVCGEDGLALALRLLRELAGGEDGGRPIERLRAGEGVDLDGG